MVIPKYWAKAEAKVSLKSGLPFTISCWRYSNESQNAAESLAVAAANQRAATLSSGIKEPSEYPDQPPREEVVKEFTDINGNQIGAVTRNSQGALILNCASLAIVDIDMTTASFGSVIRSLKNLFSKPKVPKGKNKFKAWEVLATEHLNNLFAKSKGWTGKLYRTKAGLRLFVTHSNLNPQDPGLVSFMKGCRVDPLYFKLCQVQKSFRARLTPKPIRLGLKRPGVEFPYNDEDQLKLKDWLPRYEKASQEFATCEFVQSFGATSMPSQFTEMISYHDEVAKVGSSLPLA